MDDPKLQFFHVKLVKEGIRNYEDVFKADKLADLIPYELNNQAGLQGKLYVAPPSTELPKWLDFVQTGINGRLDNLANSSTSAVLLIKHKRRLFAYTFGHGRHLLRPTAFERNFGIRVALNALKPDSLRSADVSTLEDQIIQKRAQFSRASGIERFGVDVTRDILRAVTGATLPELNFKTISGNEATLAVSVRVDFQGLAQLSDSFLNLYTDTKYKKRFAWVDNVRRVTDPTEIDALDRKFLDDLISLNPSASLALPEILEWDQVSSFSATKLPEREDSVIKIERYIEAIGKADITLEKLKQHKMHVYDNDGLPFRDWTIYDCAMFESSTQIFPGNIQRNVLMCGEWFEIDNNFAKRIGQAIKAIHRSKIKLPKIKAVETEGNYNKRVSKTKPLVLLDKILGKCESAATRIELCDLLNANQLIHVKPYKGSSSVLSHLFAQARISAEAFLRDSQFRKQIRDSLPAKSANLIPLNPPSPRDYEIIFAVLGVSSDDLHKKLPFFSQLNLLRTSEALQALGYKVSLIGIEFE